MRPSALTAVRFSSILLFSVVIPVSAEQTLDTDIFDLSIEQLTQIVVTTASKREIAIEKAPGVISVVSKEEIRSWGSRNLGDVLGRLPSTLLLDSHHISHSKLSVRSVYSNPFDSNILLLLNGRPIRDSGSGGYNPDLYRSFPLQTIEQIEVIRGPGSPIWGTNAFAGVINIITKKADKDDFSVDGSVTVGSFNTKETNISLMKGGEDFNLTSSVFAYDSKGDRFHEIRDGNGTLGNYKLGQNGQTLVAQGDYKNFGVNILYGNNQADDMRDSFTYPEEELDIDRFFANLSYRYDVNDNWYATFDYSEHHHEISWIVNAADLANTVDSIEEIFEANVYGQENKVNYLFGAVWQNLTGEAVVGGIDYKNDTRLGLYFLGDYALTKRTNIYAGFQWNDPESSASHTSPRLGLVHKINNSWWIKALYGEAFRAPFGIEMFVNAPGLVGNPALEPETIKTYDLQLIHQTENIYYALALYHSKHEDIIVRDAATTPPSQKNEGEIKYQGMEFEFNLKLNSQYTVFGNASYQTNKNGNNVNDTAFAPNKMVKLGVTYKSSTGITLNIFDTYIGEATDLNHTFGVPEVNPKADSYHLLSANIEMDMGELFNTGTKDRSFVSLHLDNILDEDIYSSNMRSRNTTNTVPTRWGFGGYLTFRYLF